MTSPLDTLLNLLSDEEQPFPKDRLVELSDPDHDQIRAVQNAWHRIPIERRRSLLQELGRLASEHIELNYESINRFALNDQDPLVRTHAIQNLWECQDPHLTIPLIALLHKDKAAQVRAAAASTLAQFVYLGELGELSSELLHQIEDALLQSVTADDDPETRRKSLEALGYSSRPEVTDLIREAHASSDEPFRQSALIAMGRSADSEWGDYIVPFLQDPSPTLRAAAAHASGELELPQAYADLIDLLEDVNANAKHEAIWALGQLGGSQAVNALANLLDSDSDDPSKQRINDALDHIAFLDGADPFSQFDDSED